MLRRRAEGTDGGERRALNIVPSASVVGPRRRTVAYDIMARHRSWSGDMLHPMVLAMDGGECVRTCGERRPGQEEDERYWFHHKVLLILILILFGK
mmetsp:Transcript_26062/g.62593  ORF Transcript_26062/g.62593 Transcript_26062/m.62593 type:complete len:96 (+) Transcript_26062:915-1202(+)